MFLERGNPFCFSPNCNIATVFASLCFHFLFSCMLFKCPKINGESQSSENKTAHWRNIICFPGTRTTWFLSITQSLTWWSKHGIQKGQVGAQSAYTVQLAGVFIVFILSGKKWIYIDVLNKKKRINDDSLNFLGSFLFMDLQRFLIIQHVDVIKLTIYMTSCWNLQDGMYAIHSPVFCYILGDRECFQDVFYDVFLTTSNLKL